MTELEYVAKCNALANLRHVLWITKSISYDAMSYCIFLIYKNDKGIIQYLTNDNNRDDRFHQRD